MKQSACHRFLLNTGYRRGKHGTPEACFDLVRMDHLLLDMNFFYCPCATAAAAADAGTLPKIMRFFSIVGGWTQRLEILAVHLFPLNTAYCTLLMSWV